MIRFITGHMELGDYVLSAEGLSGLDFQDEKTINLQMKNASIFVQSDKAVYKPKDIVRFRILTLDMNMKPLSSFELVNIFILV